MYDNLLSRRNQNTDEDGLVDGTMDAPMVKTKTITKNYGTRFARPFKTKVSILMFKLPQDNDEDIFMVENIKRKQSSLSNIMHQSPVITPHQTPPQTVFLKEEEDPYKNVYFLTE